VSERAIGHIGASSPRVLLIVAALVCVAAGGCRGGDPESTNVVALAAEGDPARSPSYASAEDAAWALVAWLRNDDPARAGSALGTVAERALERSGLDATARAAAGVASRDRWVLDYVGDGCVFLGLGMSARRFPIPVVRCGSRWCVRGREAEPSCASID
jgi:hypothetical protein